MSMPVLACLILQVTPLQSDYFKCENKCRARQNRCEVQCFKDYSRQPAQHLSCNDQCREDYYVCRKEDC